MITCQIKTSIPEFPFEVPNYRYDQNMEMFKRRNWDEEFIPYGDRLYKSVKYSDKYGYRKLDYALRNASWNIEYAHAFGNMCSNKGMYSWTEVSPKVQKFIDKDGIVELSAKENTNNVKKAAKFFGSSLTGICRFHPNLVYSHERDVLEQVRREINVPEDYKNVIVMAVEMDYETSMYSPDAIAGASTGMGYSLQAVLANQVATFIRGLGYKAIPSGNDTAISIPLAIAAGLGELGRNGLLITEKYGPRVRICKVFTDLPLKYDKPINFGVERFCDTCKKCAQKCPSRAITHGPKTYDGPSKSNFSGTKRWYIDPEKCFMFWVHNWMDCNNCVMSCPFNKPKGKLHDFVRFIIQKFPSLNKMMIQLDDFFGYGKPKKVKDFWENTKN